MSGLDETDMQILQLLVADGRRTFADIGNTVDLSGPAVSNRVDRLRDAGIIDGFTAVIDRSSLSGDSEVILTLSITPGSTTHVYQSILDADGVHRCYRTADARIVAHVVPPTTDIEKWLADHLDLELVEDYGIHSVVETDSQAPFLGTDFALACAECGNTVTAEGVTERIGDRLHHFCCPSCAEKFRNRYETIAAGQ